MFRKWTCETSIVKMITFYYQHYPQQLNKMCMFLQNFKHWILYKVLLLLWLQFNYFRCSFSFFFSCSVRQISSILAHWTNALNLGSVSKVKMWRAHDRRSAFAVDFTVLALWLSILCVCVCGGSFLVLIIILFNLILSLSAV